MTSFLSLIKGAYTLIEIPIKIKQSYDWYKENYKKYRNNTNYIRISDTVDLAERFFDKDNISYGQQIQMPCRISNWGYLYKPLAYTPIRIISDFPTSYGNNKIKSFNLEVYNEFIFPKSLKNVSFAYDHTHYPVQRLPNITIDNKQYVVVFLYPYGFNDFLISTKHNCTAGTFKYSHNNFGCMAICPIEIMFEPLSGYNITGELIDTPMEIQSTIDLNFLNDYMSKMYFRPLHTEKKVYVIKIVSLEKIQETNKISNIELPIFIEAKTNPKITINGLHQLFTQISGENQLLGITSKTKDSYSFTTQNNINFFYSQNGVFCFYCISNSSRQQLKKNHIALYKSFNNLKKLLNKKARQQLNLQLQWSINATSDYAYSKYDKFISNMDFLPDIEDDTLNYTRTWITNKTN